MKCDVLIIGAGPAGSSSAQAASRAGLKTIIVERKMEVGVPVVCSGAVGSYLFPFLPFKVPRELLVHKSEGLEFLVDNISIVRKGGPWTSYAIDRSGFDRWLADRAVDAGAEIMINTEFRRFKSDESGRLSTAIVSRNKKTESIDFRVVIGADGADSKVLEELGAKRKNPRLGRAAVFEYEGVTLSSPNLDQVYFGDFAPGGYAHIFPVSEDRANVGVGSIVDEVDLDKCFSDFLRDPRVSPQLKGARRIREKSGTVSFGQQSDRRQYGNVLLAGEAATPHLKPLVEGFLPSIICGDIAGKTAARYLNHGTPLESYQKNLDRKLGPLFKESEGLTAVLEGLTNIEGSKNHLLLAGLCSNIFSKGNIASLKNRNPEEIKARLIVEWGKKFNRAFIPILERGALSYLQARWILNSKLYKL